MLKGTLLPFSRFLAKHLDQGQAFAREGGTGQTREIP